MSEAKVDSTRERFTKEYGTDEIVVEWEPSLCFHSQNCVRSLPQVFDDSRRPWVKVDAATADEGEAAVALCPSSALRTRRVGAQPPSPATSTEVCASENGPLLVSGSVRILDAEGNLCSKARRPRSVAATVRNKPLCDGTHKTNGFCG